MKKVLNASWTRTGNVIIELKEVISFTESFGKQVPVVKNGKGETLEIEIADKSIEEEGDTLAANVIVFNFLKANNVEVFESSFTID